MITRWMTTWWMVFSSANISLVQPDLLTTCLYLAACLFVLQGRPALLRLALAAGYLAMLSCWFFVDRRRAFLAGAVLVVCCTLGGSPFANIPVVGRSAIPARSTMPGRSTASSAGSIGRAAPTPLARSLRRRTPSSILSRSKQFIRPGTSPRIGLRRLLEKTPFSSANQLRELQENGAPAVWYWFSTPGRLAILALGARMKDWSGFRTELRSRWMLSLPALATVGMYVAVFFETRYVAPQYFFLGTLPLHAAYLRCGPAAARLFPLAAAAALFFTLLAELGVSAKSLLLEGNTPNPFAEVAAELYAAGATPGTPVALVGLTLQPEWARQAGLRIIGDVPIIYDRDPGLHRYINFNRANLIHFWHGSPSARERTFQGFASAGARFVVTHEVPPSADLTGWTRLPTKVDLLSGRSHLWIRPITPPADLPAKSAVDIADPVPSAAQGSAVPKNPPGPA